MSKNILEVVLRLISDLVLEKMQFFDRYFIRNKPAHELCYIDIY